MDIDKFVSTAQEAITVRRVFAEPIERDGITVIPAARVAGGGGGGAGSEKAGAKGEGGGPGKADAQGEGGGFGLNGSPAGAFVIKGDTVRWIPAVDPHRIVATVGAVVITVVLARGWVATRAIKASRAS